MELSVVTTLYQSSAYIAKFYDGIIKEVQQITEDYEIIFVNDGSVDNSLDVVLSLMDKDPKIKVLDLSRNFGHHKAMMTGLSYSKGSLVFLIDCDLEEDPALLGLFHSTYKDSNVDVVYGVQARRKGELFERLTGYLFYLLVNFLSDHRVPANALVARLMSRRYVNALVKHEDRELFILGVWTITGFEQMPVSVTKRSKGQTSYTFIRKVAIFVNAVTSFSSRPLVFIFYMGLAIMLMSGVGAFWLLIQKIFNNAYLAGWPSLIVSIWMLGGITVFCIGIVGIYLSKIFSETKRRPYTIIRRIYQKNEDYTEI